jgi:HEAT repeat protein
VIDVLLSVLRSGVGSRDLEELLRAVGRIVAASLADGQLQRATRVLRQLRQVVAVEEDPAVAQAVRATLDGVGSAQVLAPLFERIQAGWEGVDEEALGALLHALPVSAAPALAGALEQLADRRMRRLFCTVIAGLVRDDVERLAPLMVADSWYVTRNLAYILGLTHNPASQRILRELAGHPHERVRLEALRSLSQFRGATTRSLVLRALDDPDRGVRMQALGVVTGYPDPATTRALLTRLADRGFSRLDAQEKRALAVATGRLARDAALPELTALLQQRSLLGRARSEEERAAAVHGLAAVGSPAAQAQLAQLAQESAGARALVEQALREAHAPPPPPEGA